MEGAPALAPIDHGTPAVDPAILDRALRSHLHWKMHLYAIIVDQDAQALDRPRLCADGHCDLGRWIHDDHGEFADAPRFGALREAHRQFHLSAGRICDLAVAGDWNEALRELHAGAFYRWSEEVARCIASLRGGPGNGPQASSP
jgi:methyl-accepting chemotaxis protein